MTLLDDLKIAARQAAGETDCPACIYLEKIEDEPTRNAMREALAGTIGIRKLGVILKRHEAGFGRRTIERHRREEHS